MQQFPHGKSMETLLQVTLLRQSWHLSEAWQCQTSHQRSNVVPLGIHAIIIIIIIIILAVMCVPSVLDLSFN